MHSTKKRLLEAGMQMLLRCGYNALGIKALLQETNTAKGVFYHHFESKEDFALQAVDMYMQAVHQGLEVCLGDTNTPPVERVRGFFEATQEKYREEGYLGCLLGGLGQELSGVSETFRSKIEWCFSEIASRIAVCLEEAREQGMLAEDTDPRQMANLLVDCWEGAALRTRLLGDPKPLRAMLNFYFDAARPR